MKFHGQLSRKQHHGIKMAYPEPCKEITRRAHPANCLRLKVVTGTGHPAGLCDYKQGKSCFNVTALSITGPFIGVRTSIGKFDIGPF